MPLPPRPNILALVHDWTASESLRRHMLAVEAAMVAYARRDGEDEALWGATGLVHDFDYERFPNADQRADEEHPAEGVRHLRALGYPEALCEAVLGHAHYTGVPRVTRLAKALFACDELTGLITAAALVKPSKSLADVDVPGIRRKMKDKAFARGVSREDIAAGAEAMGVPLDEHIGIVLEAMRGIADQLGLDGSAAAPAGSAAAAPGAAPDGRTEGAPPSPSDPTPAGRGT